jgi:hypothetical protein
MPTSTAEKSAAASSLNDAVEKDDHKNIEAKE